MKKHLMFDLETLGTPDTEDAPKGVIILSIGAAVFDPESHWLGNTFYVNVDPNDCRDLGLKADPAVMDWWTEQPPDAFQAVIPDRKPLAEALDLFVSFIEQEWPYEYWANSPSFDKILLAKAFQSVGKVFPMDYWNENCVRTVKKAAERKTRSTIIIKNGTAHKADDDAIKQCRVVQHAHRLLYCSESERLHGASR